MPDGWPNQLKSEVKTSRDNQHKLSERDLAGIRPDGYTTVLIGGRVHHGPRWILLPASLLTPGGFSESTLSQLGEGVQPDLCDRINLIWSDWILDESVWRKLFEQHHMELQAAPFPLRQQIHVSPPTRKTRIVSRLRPGTDAHDKIGSRKNI